MGNVRPSLSESIADRLQHILHSSLAVQHASGFLIIKDIVFDFPLHLRVDFLAFNDLQQDRIDFSVEQFMLIVEGCVLDFEGVPIEHCFI